MSDSKMSEEFSDIKQRAAVCYSQFDKKETKGYSMSEDLLFKTLDRASLKLEKSEAQSFPQGITPFYMVVQKPAYAVIKSMTQPGINSVNPEGLSLPIFIACREPDPEMPYYPDIKVKATIALSTPDSIAGEENCGISEPYFSRVTPCIIDIPLTEEYFKSNGAGWRVYRTTAQFKFGPSCIPKTQNIDYTLLNLAYTLYAEYTPQYAPLETRVIIMRPGADPAVSLPQTPSASTPSFKRDSYLLTPTCGLETPPEEQGKDRNMTGIGSSNFDRLSEILKKKIISKAGAFPNYPEVGEESEALSNCKSKTVYAAMSSIERECAKEIHRGKRRACIGKFAKQVCSKHNDCALVHGETNQMIDCSEYAANSIRLLKDEIAPKLKSVATLTPIDFDHKLMIGSQSFMVKVSDTEVTRKRGLMYTNKLKEGNGMLFTFDEEADHTMWMKNVNIPLDMIFIDKDKKVVKVQTVQPCESKPCELYKAGQPIMHVLELNPGEFTGNVGDTISIEKIEREYNTDFKRRGLS